MDVWLTVLSTLEKRVEESVYSAWLKPTRFLGETNVSLRVSVPDVFFGVELERVIQVEGLTRTIHEVLAITGRQGLRLQFLPETTLITLESVYEHRSRLGPNRITELREPCGWSNPVHRMREVPVPSTWGNRGVRLPYGKAQPEFCERCFYTTADPEASTRERTWYKRYGSGWTQRHEHDVPLGDLYPDESDSVKAVQGGRPDSSRRRH